MADGCLRWHQVEFVRVLGDGSHMAPGDFVVPDLSPLLRSFPSLPVVVPPDMVGTIISRVDGVVLVLWPDPPNYGFEDPHAVPTPRDMDQDMTECFTNLPLVGFTRLK